MTNLFNMCFLQGKFPKILKSGHVIPIYKSGDAQLPENHRPICQTSPFAKLLERCIYNRMYKFLNKYSLIDSRQFGFQKGLSTENAASLVFNEFCRQLDKKNTTCAIFLDFRKAFDSVNHKILLKKLYRYGFRDTTFKLLTSFLSDRTQTVDVQGYTSAPLSVSCGVPQGSVLGPLYFLLSVNDFPLASNFKTSLFADDACLMLSHSSPTILEDNLNRELPKISKWIKSNMLSLNYKKTVFMTISNKKIKPDLKVTIDNHDIQEVTSVKYLGVTFDNKLNWQAHIDKTNNKISKACYAIVKLSKIVNLKTLKLVYYALAYSVMMYCLTIWGRSTLNHINKIIVKQKK